MLQVVARFAFIGVRGQGLLTAYRCSGCLGAKSSFPYIGRASLLSTEPHYRMCPTGRGALALPQRRYVPGFSYAVIQRIKIQAVKPVLYHKSVQVAKKP